MLVSSLVTVSILALAAAPDNNVEWNGLSHYPIYDREPECPLGGEAFAVSLKCWHLDLTAVRARVFDGSEVFVNGTFSHNDGPYDVWTVQIPSTAANTISYFLEVTDGTDTDYVSPAGITDAAPVGNGWTLNFTTLEHAPLGATVAAGGVVFRVWAPNALSARVAGEFNGWNTTAHPMTKTGEYWARFVAGAVAGLEYKYIFNNRDR